MVRRRILAALAVVMITVSSLIGVAWQGRVDAAQQASVIGGNALKVSPVRQDLTADPGTKKTVTIYVTNVTSVPATLHVVENDFVAAGDESGKPNVILDEKQYAPSHSLKRFMQPVKDFTLAANGTKQIDVVLDIPKTAAGGGYFGAVRFEPASQTSDKTLSVSASVGSLILLKVNGTIKEQLSVESFDVRQKGKAGRFFTNSKDLTAVVRFRNGGNVQVAPFGKVLASKSGKELSSQEINESKPLGSVLPDSVRRFEVTLNKIGGFGKYTVKGNFGYGSTGQLLSSSVTFYVVPIATLVALGLGLILILLLIFVAPRLIKSYNRKVIRSASKKRR
ncbi:MAG TPA: hypothetical protein VMR45_02295 [Patescibacteria group bacterium]|nr:hypothetical protein [Patescibacteria group bacterium]